MFTPAADFNGTASFDYTVQDNGTTNGAADPKTDIGHASASPSPRSTTRRWRPTTRCRASPRTAARGHLLCRADRQRLQGSGQRGRPDADHHQREQRGRRHGGDRRQPRRVHADGQLQRHGLVRLHDQDNGTTNGVADPRTDTGHVTFTSPRSTTRRWPPTTRCPASPRTAASAASPLRR